MIAGALFYYQSHSIRNRLRMRLQRLRQPKYLFGAIVGVLYFYSYAWRNFRRGGVGRASWLLQHQYLAESVGALVLLGLLLMVWILPHSRAALTFSEAEIAFLFPAPIDRRALLHFKLLKSQSAILFSAFFVTLLGRGIGGGNFLMRALDWWGLLSIYNLHLLGSSFAVTMLMDRGVSTWKRRALVVGLVGIAGAALILWIRQALPPPPLVITDFSRLGEYARTVFQTAPMRALLYPFRLMLAPFFTVSAGPFLAAFWPVLAIIALHYFWVVHSDVAFEEASIEASRKLAERVTAVRSGQWWGSGTKKPKPARAPFRLRPAGNPLVAVLWKNLISAGSLVTTRVWLTVLWVVIVVGMISQSSHSHQGIGAMIGLMALTFVAISLVSGPQMLRNDLRQDLPVADVLKTFPMPGWQIVLGEILAPAAMLAGAQWLLLIVGLVFWPENFGGHRTGLPLRGTIAVVAAIVLPCVDVIAMVIPNAAVLFFPAWFHLGKDAPRGFETAGQQIILMFGQLFVLICSLIPAAGVFAAIFLTGSFLHVPMPAAIAGAVAAAIILLAEAALAVHTLGNVFEDFDLSAELLNS